MRRRRFGLDLAIAVVAAVVAIPLFAVPAVAVVSGCVSSGSPGTVGVGPGSLVPGAQIGEFPAQPASQSALKIACTFTSAAASPVYTIHDFKNAGYHQGEARKLLLGATFIAGSSTVVVSSINAVNGFVNHGISGTGIAPRAVITAVALNSPAAGKSTFTLNLKNTGASGAAGSPLLVDNGTARAITDALFLAPFTDLTSATAHFVGGVAPATDAGHSISGTGLSDSGTIAAVTSATKITLSTAPQATTTIAAASGGVNVTTFTGLPANTIHLASNTYVPGSGSITVHTSATTTGATAAVLSFTGKSGTTDLTGVKLVSGTGTLTSGGNVNVVPTAVIRAADITTSARSVEDTAATCTSTSITSAGAGFGPDDIGMDIYGTGIAAGAVITAVNTTTKTATIAGGAVTTSPCPGKTAGTLYTVGTPSVTAPKDGDVALEAGNILDLNPNLVTGLNACALAKPEGFGLVGTWANPGSVNFISTGFSVPPFTSGATVGELQFKTSVITYSAYIVQQPNGDSIEPSTAHYDIMFGNIPTSSAACPSSPAGVATSTSIVAQTPSQSAIAAGVGRPATSQFRALAGLASGTLATNAYVVSTLSGHTYNISGSCLMNSTPTADFHCGS
jgi:hypothetical protein